MLDLGIGYKRMLKKHFGLKLDLGYNLKNFREEGYNYVTDKKIIYSSIHQSLTCGIGFNKSYVGEFWKFFQNLL